MAQDALEFLREKAAPIDALTFLRNPDQATNRPLDPALSSLSAVSSGAALQKPALPSFNARNQQGDIPLDSGPVQTGTRQQVTAEGFPIDTPVYSGGEGVPALIQLESQMQRLKEDKLKVLQKYYPSTRLSDTGEPIVRVQDSKNPGQFRDILANPQGMDANDMMDLLANAPEIVGGFLAARKGDVRGVGKTLMNLGRVAVGAEGAGALKDVAARSMEGQPINPEEIASARAGAAAQDVLWGGLFTGLSKAGTKLISPFANPAPAQYDLQQAKERLRSKFSVDLPNTPGELTGNMLLLRSEAFAREKPGSSGAFAKMVEKQNEDVQTIQDIITGKVTAQSLTDTGEAAIGAIGARVAPLQREISSLAKDVQKTGTSELIKASASAVGKGMPLDKSVVGQSLRDSALARRDQWKAASGYAEFFDNPVTKTPNVTIGDMADQASDLIKKMPGKEKVTSTPTGILDEFGKPITRDETGKEVFREFIPDNVLSRLQRLSTEKDSKLSLDQLKQMRTEIDDDIVRGEAIPGVKNSYLKQIRDMLTNKMNSTVASYGDKSLSDEWQFINKSYAENVKKFEQKGIAEFFRDPQNPNWIGNHELVNRAIQNPDTYTEYKKFFGDTSPEFGQVKRAISDDIFSSVTNPLSGTVDAGQFVQRLKGLWKDSPQIAKDVFGPDSRKLYAIAGAMDEATVGQRDIAQAAVKGLKGRVDIGELTDLLQSKNPTVEKLTQLISKTNELNDRYRNQVVKAIGTGEVSAMVDPTKFVNAFSTKAAPEEIRQVLSSLADRPDLQESIRRHTAMDILSSARGDTEALTKRFGQSGTLSAPSLEKAMALKDPIQVERYRSILGDETWADLQSLGQYLQPRSARTATFGTAGRLSAGSQIAQLEKGNIFGFLDAATRNFVTAVAYSNPIIRKWIGNTRLTPANQAAVVSYVTSSTPFIEALYSEFGQKGAREKAAQLKFAIDHSMQAQP